MVFAEGKLTLQTPSKTSKYEEDGQSHLPPPDILKAKAPKSIQKPLKQLPQPTPKPKTH
ncbi:hypothetical protein IHV12_21815 [Fictibacillus sp. 7GRE50]|uniref:hypothetical protein n=1 Tax=Fictibacillus sp. 7GRE50 TaxID=2745878 RepID=UPI0018CCC63D|nr:hypothetical protein [Fictibacillus sp. 7GRE50]MBH0167550.1 hypothetical protein [Fictibacillus sp. 7GRE50]